MKSYLYIGESQCNAVKLKLNELHNYLNENKNVQFNFNLNKMNTEKTLSELNLLINSFKSYLKKDICFSIWEHLYDFSAINKLMNSFKFYVRNDIFFSIWERLPDFSVVNELFEIACEKITAYNKTKSEILLTYEDSVFSIDVRTMLKKFQFEYNSFF